MNDSSSASKSKQPLGEILVEAGLVSPSQIKIALQEQQEHDLRIGEILALHGWISQKTADFFVLQWSNLLHQPQKKPLVYYFSEAGLLSKTQIQRILKLQKQREPKIRFHNLAVELGYLKQFTVDFFLANLFNIYNPNSRSFAKPYSLIKDYTQGMTNFKRTDLAKATLMGVSLKKIVLDGSNLKEADLTMANFSGSSFVQVELNSANLTKAILTEVNFERAFLMKTNLQQAHLKKANFQSANLQGANLQKAYLSQASFAGANLTQAKLPIEYPYTVYYDKHTCFDPDFNPKQMGWQKISS
ncbi:MAG: pentapeptide repeat-containing protein [Xenococcaceae cyanobacterium MO_207.B15]|nr:pentapeptide repeat-containing protein [Xenococcaceae cyanobacterium MO_207.B15]